MSTLPSPELSYPPAAAAALECASYLVEGDERDDMLRTLRDNYNVEGNDLDGWTALVRTWFKATSHIYCAAFIAQAESEAEIDQEVEAIARELAGE
jgi:hypothetical protein